MRTKQDAPLRIDLPKPQDERPAWSRVGVVAFAGFAVGVVWPRLAGVAIGPSVPADARPSPEAAATASAAAQPSGAPAAAAASAPGPSGALAPVPAQTVVVGPGKITRCWDKKDKKLEDCGKLQFDPIALPKLEELAKCPAAMGLDGKLTLGFEIDFKTKDVHVSAGKKKQGLPASTVQGVLQCAARELTGVALDEVPAKHRRYSLTYVLTFHPPNKQPDEAPAGAKGTTESEDDEKAAGATTSESGATGTATVTWDTALVRKDPKDGEVVARFVRGTRVKLLAKQNDWYRVEAMQKTGWVYRGAIGL